MRPVIVRHWLTVITVECPACDVGATVMLVGAQVAYCPACGAPLVCGGFVWKPDVGSTPTIIIGRPESLTVVS